MTNLNNGAAVKILRLVSALGVGLLAFYKILNLSALKPNQEYSFYALIIIAVVFLQALVILRRAFLTILQNPDIFVPVGLYITASSLLGSVVQLPAYIGLKDGVFSWVNIGPALAAAYLLNLLLAVCFTGWITRALLGLSETGKVDLMKSLAGARKWFPRTLAALFFGGVPVYLLLFAVFPLVYRLNRGSLSEIVTALIFVIVVFTLVWNILTAMLLPHVLSSPARLRTALFEGVRISWRNKRKTIAPALLLMIAAGWIVFVSVTYRDYSAPAQEFGTSSFAGGYSTKSQFNYAAEFVWVGDYQESSKWHKTMMEAVRQEPLETVSFRVMILMLVLSLVVNFEIIRRSAGKPAMPAQTGRIAAFNAKILLIAGLFGLFFPVELLSPRFYSSSDENGNLTDASVFSAPKVLTDEKILAKKTFLAAAPASEHWILDIFTGNFDGQAGDEKVVVYRDKAIVYDARENPQAEIKFNLGKTEDSKAPSDALFDEIEVVDFDDDGAFEFLGVGSYPDTAFLVDRKGDVVWKYAGEGIDVKAVDAVDVDDDKRKELVVIDKNFIKIFDRAGSEIRSIATKTDFYYDDYALTANPDKPDEPAFLIKSFSLPRIFGLDGNKVAALEKPESIAGFLFIDKRATHSLYFAGNKFGLFDLKGNLKAKYDAPFSEIHRTYWEKMFDEIEVDKKYSVISARAARFRINENGDALLAVIASLGSPNYDYKDMLYVYDRAGRIVYQELFDDMSMELRVVPSETRIGTEDLIVIARKNIWKYTIQ